MINILFIQPFDLPKISTGKNRKFAYLSRTGFEVAHYIPTKHDFSILDLNCAIKQGKTIFTSIKEEVLNKNPKIIFVTFPSFAQGFQVEAVIHAIRKINTDCKIVLGGGAISLIKDAPMRWWNKYKISGCYDGFGVETEEIINYLLGEKNDLPAGFYTGKNCASEKGKLILTDKYSAENFYSAGGRIDFQSHLESFRLSGLQPIGIIEMMRGCQYGCNFCAINKKRLGCHFRSVKTVADEAMFLANHNINHIHLIDPTFGLDQDMAFSLLDSLSQVSKRYGTTFETVTRTNMISDNFAKAMKEAGVVRCDIGMETMSPEGLNQTEKRINPELTKMAIECLSCHKIQTKLFHICFPGDISMATINFLTSLAEKRIDFLVQSSYLRSLPTPESPPLFFDQDQLVFTTKDTIEQLMERVLINLSFKSMDTSYNESRLKEIVKTTIKKGLSLKTLFEKQKIKNDQFTLRLLPKFNGNSYIYVHQRGRPFSHGMCRI